MTKVAQIANYAPSSTGLKRVGAIPYDPEHWAFTPISEQESIGPSSAAAQSLASRDNTKLIIAPALDLIKVLAPGQKDSQGYLALDIAGEVAPHACAIDIQAQALEANPIEYTSFVRQAATQAFKANSSIVIFAGLSTNPSGHRVTATELFQDVQST